MPCLYHPATRITITLVPAITGRPLFILADLVMSVPILIGFVAVAIDFSSLTILTMPTLPCPHYRTTIKAFHPHISTYLPPILHPLPVTDKLVHCRSGIHVFDAVGSGSLLPIWPTAKPAHLGLTLGCDAWV